MADILINEKLCTAFASRDPRAIARTVDYCRSLGMTYNDIRSRVLANLSDLDEAGFETLMYEADTAE